ncbi:MAG: hypothetical protein Q4B86_02005 [Eubacteriales bacterium]|nr:hypothetical protein [Eubacteriales bacterium]
MKKLSNNKAYFHLPGLFEFYELYKLYLELYKNHREYFYDYCEIGSIYGAPSDCMWGGGRIEDADTEPKEVLSLLRKYNISGRLTFSNSLLSKEDLSDRKCNEICRLFGKYVNNGIIIHSDLLLQYIQNYYPDFYFVSSTTKVLTRFDELVNEVNREEFAYVVPDFRLNKEFDKLKDLNQEQKDKIEFLCNECCYFGCKDRKECYEAISRKSLGIDMREHFCKAPEGNEGYRFSKAMENPSFISVKDINDIYLPMGFSNFKLEGRGLGSALVLEILLYYMVKPEYQIHVREAIYLDNMLDLF